MRKNYDQKTQPLTRKASPTPATPSDHATQSAPRATGQTVILTTATPPRPAATPPAPHPSIGHLSDAALYELCREYGSRALEWRRKFIGLLPEVNRREQNSRKRAAREGGRSWLGRRGFSSNFEFAAKTAGINEDQVTEVLRLERRLIDQPALYSQLITGEVSHHKIARVVSVSSPETAVFWAQKTLVLSKSALATLVKEEKTLHNALSGQSSLPETAQMSNIPLKSSTAARLRELQEKGIDIDKLINRFLDRREEEIEAQKARLGVVHNKRSATASRYIPAKIRQILLLEHGRKCSIPSCRRPATAIHHTRRFALAGSHDPRYLAPLCREHHQIAHSIDRKFMQKLGVPQVGACHKSAAASHQTAGGKLTFPASSPFPHDRSG